MAKFIAALLVVAIHTSGYLYFNNTATFKNYFFYRGFLDIAVPLFFAISGYLIADKDTVKMKIYTKKIALLFAFSTVLFIIFRFSVNIVVALINHTNLIESVKPTLQVFTVDNLISGILGWGHLWYLSASVFACILLIFFTTKKYTSSKILVISSIIYVLSLSSMVNIPSLTYAGGVPLALVCMALGIYVAREKTALNKPSSRQYIVNTVCFLSIISFFIVARWLSAPVMFNILLPLAVYFLLILLAQPGKSNILSVLGKYSLWIYILHPIFIEILYTIIYPRLGLGGFIYSSRIVVISIIISTSLSILFSIPMERVWIRIQNKYLNHMSTPARKTRHN